MRPVSLALSLLVVISASACTFAARKHRGTGVAADVAAIAGAVALGSRQRCPELIDDFDRGWDCGIDNAERTVVGGALLLTAGVLGLATIIMEYSDRETAAEAPTPSAPRFEAPTPPSGAIDPDIVRLGLQAWRTASAGYCDASRDLMRTIASRDAAYHAQLSLNASIASCL